MSNRATPYRDLSPAEQMRLNLVRRHNGWQKTVVRLESLPLDMRDKWWVGQLRYAREQVRVLEEAIRKHDTRSE